MSTQDTALMSAEEKMAIVCMFFARLESDDPRYKGKYAGAFEVLSKKYGVKTSTLKNNKDRYDSVFNNGRKGWHQKPLEEQHKFLYSMFKKYEELSLEEHQNLADTIVNEANAEGKPYYSIKTKDADTVNKILNRSERVEFDGLNVLRDEIKIGQPVFIVFGGDKPPWETGLVGMGVVTKEPYDIGYSRNNYKIQVDVKLLLDEPIKRKDLLPFQDAYDIIGIGPITKWEPNQALSKISERKSAALMRAMLELSPSIENDLADIVDEEMLNRIKGATTKLIPVEVNLGEEIQKPDSEDESADYNDVFEPDFDEIISGLIMGKRPLETLTTFINMRKHIIFNGPPGTGKTTIAERAAEQAQKCRFVDGYIMTTAVSDWSTFDTIGGYMPDKTGQLQFQEGIFLTSIRENKWLIIDEINRAEVDKAFGHFFTVLSEKNIVLPFSAETPTGEQNIKIAFSEKLSSRYDYQSATYYIGRNWRILSTMNTYDKNSLFMLSYAFMRRFSFVNIPALEPDNLKVLIDRYMHENDGYSNSVFTISEKAPRKLGTAVIIDVMEYLKHSDESSLAEALCSLVIPQFEGITGREIKQIYKDFGALLSSDEKSIFRNSLIEFFDISESELLNVKFDDIDDTADEEM